MAAPRDLDAKRQQRVQELADLLASDEIRRSRTLFGLGLIPKPRFMYPATREAWREDRAIRLIERGAQRLEALAQAAEDRSDSHDPGMTQEQRLLGREIVAGHSRRLVRDIRAAVERWRTLDESPWDEITENEKAILGHALQR